MFKSFVTTVLVAVMVMVANTSVFAQDTLNFKAEMYAGIADVGLQYNHPESAESLIVKAIAIEPENVGFLNILGESLVLQDRYDEALEILSKAYAISPGIARTATLYTFAAIQQSGSDGKTAKLADSLIESFDREYGQRIRSIMQWYAAEKLRGGESYHPYIPFDERYILTTATVISTHRHDVCSARNQLDIIESCKLPMSGVIPAFVKKVGEAVRGSIK